MICARLFPCGSHLRSLFRSVATVISRDTWAFPFRVLFNGMFAAIVIHENFCNDLRKQVQLFATYRSRSAAFRIAIIDSPALLTQISREKHLREEWKSLDTFRPLNDRSSSKSQILLFGRCSRELFNLGQYRTAVQCADGWRWSNDLDSGA